MALAIGGRLGTYEILGWLGQGGMGEVYRARDLRLAREVAIKVLPAGLEDDPERLTRFEREARMLAALNHPNIATIYGLDQSAGPLCLVMELVPGETLAERLRSGPLSVQEALRVAGQMAEALEAAHKKGVIHRDLKPGNIMVTPEGRVKLLDFGLAKALGLGSAQQNVAEELTVTALNAEAGSILGTPAYMSPEQARGRPVDARTDIWAFGCVLYELLTGERAFRGETWPDTLAAVLAREPDLGALPASTPVGVRELLRRCLQKNPDHRPTDIAEARVEIEEAARAPGTTSSPTPHPSGLSLAVLPFANASDDPQMEYLSDGLTESIIFSLSQLPQLRVMARSMVFQYKADAADAREIGRRLGVGAVLAGRVLQRGETLLVSAELIDVADGWQLWGAQYRRKAADILATEEEIAKEISGTLRLKLTPEKEILLAKRRTDNVAAYHLYLKGRFYWGKRTEEGLYKGIQFFRQAIETDPAYALAYAGLAEGYIPLAVYGHLAPTDALPKARAAAQKALEIDPELVVARTVLAGMRTFFDWDQTAAEKELRAAIALDPTYPRSRQALAEYLLATKRLAEAIAVAGQALELDPLSLSLQAAVAMAHYYAGQYGEAIEQGRRAVEMDPSFFPAHWFMGLAHEQEGRFAEAVAKLQQARALSNNSSNMIASLGGAFAAWGKVDEARGILHELEDLSRRKYVAPTLVAAIFARLGEQDRAFALLNEAYEGRCAWLRFLAVDPRLVSLRSDSRFQALLRRMGYLHQ